MTDHENDHSAKAAPNRRHVLGGMAALGASPLFAPLASTLAEAQSKDGVWRSLANLSREAERLGLSVPRMGLSAAAAEETYTETLPAVIDFMDGVQASAADARGVSSADVDSILDQASELLRTVRNAERTPRDGGPAPGAAAFTVPSFDSIAKEYLELFETCKIKDDKRSEVGWYTSKITDPSRRKYYEQVTEETCVPWYFVAIVHGMECGFDITAHLHNGDSLKKKTWQVPAGRPDPWNPPNDWVSSAVDAMKVDKFHEKADWDLAKMLYRWEAYNGWRSRVLKGIKTPYLWSFSNHYTKGKFVADGVWDQNAVSKQCGAAVMLKSLVEQGSVKVS